MPDPVNRTILLLDIERFGTHDEVQQAFMRRVLYDVVQDTLRAAEVEQTEARLEDRGDSVMVFVDAAIPRTRVLRALLRETPAALAGYNRLAASSAQVRLRMVLAEGEVALHEIPGAIGGAVGRELNQAFRLLNSDELRTALKAVTGDCVLCVSDSVYQRVVRQGHPGLVPEEFHPVPVLGKEGELTAWVHGVAPTGRADDRSTAATGPARTGPAPTGPAPTYNGGVAGRDQITVSGSTVHGDVVFGGRADGHP
ncbi:hypothetical protein [Streptacidiphilus jiangxiensis]|uniref:Adenylate cyclase, class 3 n=1 Tax=Streptacidiphilus jiangxiensis TaxID=235985 RepID=A0A1H7M4A2_STRJI|nr:hypothetical protein [Streptacidiphilus jiangxiensis]SEL05961.1 Adenylate cyclase, class 3 [Streptacidiphilus jiangxiensis]